MPNKPLRLCTYPGCNQLVASGRCEKHAKQEQQRYDKQRGSYRERGYTSQWDKVRDLYLRQHPLCEACHNKGNIVKATVVHHINPIQQGGALLDLNNLKALCNDCHENIHGKDRFKRNPLKDVSTSSIPTKWDYSG